MVNYVVKTLAVPEFMPEISENSQNIQFCEKLFHKPGGQCTAICRKVLYVRQSINIIANLFLTR